MNWIEAAGYLASALVLTTFCMKTMIPLHYAAICSNAAFIVYGFYDHLYPVLILHVSEDREGTAPARPIRVRRIRPRG
jgi:CRP/FNR family cyclic AMP-dependent transcriptional regulator